MAIMRDKEYLRRLCWSPADARGNRNHCKIPRFLGDADHLSSSHSANTHASVQGFIEIVVYAAPPQRDPS